MNDIKNKYIILLFAILYIVPQNANSQQIMSIDECVQQALIHNIKVRNANNEMSIAEQDKANAFTNYFPSVSASAAGFLASNELVQMSIAPGMDMAMVKDGVTAGVTASMPLFAGGQIVNGNKLAQVNVDANKLKVAMSKTEVQLNTETYYWRVVMLKEKLNTLDVVEKQLSTMQHDVQAAVDAGVTTRNDLLRVQLKQNEIKSSRITVDNALNLSRRMLAQYIGKDGENIDINTDFGGNMPESPQTLYILPDNALTQTNEYNLLQQNIKANDVQRKMAIGKNLPTVAIGGGYMFENLLDKNHTFWAGFATVSVPITAWWGGSHDIKKKKLQLANAKNTFDDQSQMLIIRMQNTWNELNDAYKQVQISLQSIEQSTENLRMNNDFYSAGTCTMSDLLDAQTLFQQSKDGYVEAYTNYEIKKREYLQSTGR